MKRTENLKTLILVFVMAVFPGFLFAQYTFGVKAGANFANLTGSSVENNSMIVGYNFGGLFNYSMEDVISGPFGEIFSLQIELYGETKGTESDYLFTNPDTLLTGVEQNFTYITIPVLAKFTFGDPDMLQFYFNAGFFGSSLFGLKIDGEVKRDHDDEAATDRRKYREEYAGFDMGVLAGVGANFPLNDHWAVFVDGRYAMGLTNIGEFKSAQDIPEEQLEDVKTTTIGASAGILYRLQ